MPAANKPYRSAQFNVRDFGATGNGTTDDTAAIQAAIDAAKVSGVAGSTRSGMVLVPDGTYSVSSPLILPLSGTTPDQVVRLCGLNFHSCRLTATSSFPTGRGMIETDTAAAWDGTYRTYYAHIHDLSLHMPNVLDTRAIWFRKSPSAASNSAAWVTEILLENLQIFASNQYHPIAIKADTGFRYSSCRNIYLEPAQATPTYATVLFDFPDGSSENIIEYGDDVGGQLSLFINCQPMVRRGGYCRLVSGRLNHSLWINSFCNGARFPSQGACIRLVESKHCTFINFSNEGLGESNQIYLDDCDQITFNDVGVGTPDSPLNSRANSTAYALGDLVVDSRIKTTSAVTKKYFTCTTAGTSGGSVPAWDSLTDTQTITDGSVTWTCTGDAIGDAIQVVNSRFIRFRGKLGVPGSGVFSVARLCKIATVDSNSVDVLFEDFGLRPVTAGDGSTEYTFSGTNCRASGYTVTGSTASPVWTPYRVGDQGTATFNPADLADGAGETTTVTVTGAALGDIAVASFSLDLQGITLSAWVSAANTVSVRFQNESGGSVNLASGTLKARIFKS